MGDDDILSQGAERRPGGWPGGWRGKLAAAAALAVVLAAIIAVNLPRHHRAPARPPASASHAAQVPPLPPPLSVTGVPAQPDGVSGPVSPWPASLRIPVTGSRPAWFYPATGRRVPIGGLPANSAGYLFTKVSGGWAIQVAARSRVGCGNCAGFPLRVYFLADRAASVTQIGVADGVAPAATADAVWLTSYLPGTRMSTAAATAREVSMTGLPAGPQVTLPAGYAIDQATSRGLLLASIVPRPGRAAWQLWDPARQRATRTFAGVIAANATEIAWTPPCARYCRTRVLNLATGQDTVIRLPRGSSAANGAFSPDGSLLALQVSVSSGGDGGALAMQLEVAAVAGGRPAVVPGTWASSDALVGFGWPAGGESLVAELSFMTKVQVTAWRPGAARLAVAVVAPGQAQGALIVG